MNDPSLDLLERLAASREIERQLYGLMKQAHAEVDRLRGLIEQHRQGILGPDLEGIPCEQDMDLWEAALGQE